MSRKGKEARAFLEEKQLPKLLEDFVLDCAKERPDDVVTYMAQWAHRRSSRRSLLNLRNGTANGGKEPILVVLLGLEDRDDVFEDLDVEVEERSEPLATHVQAVRHQLLSMNLVNPSIAAFETSHQTFVVVDVGDLTPTRNSLMLLSVADAVILHLSCATAEEDLAKRREGFLYNQVLAANSLGVKKAVVLITDFRGDDATAATAVSEAQLCFTNSGFPAENVTLVRFSAAEDLLGVLGSATLTTMKRPPAVEHANQCDVTVMAIGADGLSVGETLSGFCKDSFGCRVNAIGATLDKETNKVVARNPFLLKRGEVGTLTLAIVEGAILGIHQPIVLTKGNKIAAFGTITFVETGGDTTTDEFDLSDGTATE